jgi:hypothetical protein
MAIVKEMDMKAWEEWVKTRPPAVKELCRKLPPDRLYRLKNRDVLVTIVSYSEDNTVTVSITGEYNVLAFDREVFGVNPKHLKECNLPKEGEIIGTPLTGFKEYSHLR